MQWMFNSEANCKKQYLLLQTVPIKQSKLVEMEILWALTSLFAMRALLCPSLLRWIQTCESATSRISCLVMAAAYKWLDWFWGNGSAFPLVKLELSLCSGMGKEQVAAMTWLWNRGLGFLAFPTFPKNKPNCAVICQCGWSVAFRILMKSFLSWT